jgi:hypothetical protein
MKYLIAIATLSTILSLSAESKLHRYKPKFLMLKDVQERRQNLLFFELTLLQYRVTVNRVENLDGQSTPNAVENMIAKFDSAPREQRTSRRPFSRVEQPPQPRRIDAERVPIQYNPSQTAVRSFECAFAKCYKKRDRHLQLKDDSS